MNEAETRAEYIDPKLKESGWGEVEGSKVLREFRITDGKIQTGGTRGKPEIADYILVYKNRKIGVIEAKAENLEATEGVAQAKVYAEKLRIDYTYASNGKEIYEISMKTGEEGSVDKFPAPEELWKRKNAQINEWKEKFASVPNEGEYGQRYYQEIAINNVLNAVAEEKTRILLAMATGTGKTAIAFQIAWKFFQTFMSGSNSSPYFGDYPPDFFDFIIIDECHRGGANDEGNWRGIMEYFFPAVQLGLTATPKRKDNLDTYKYFGEPVYIYSIFFAFQKNLYAKVKLEVSRQK